MDFYQPTFNGVTYDLAVCSVCSIVLADTTSRNLGNHRISRKHKTGDCQTREREGRTVAESIGVKVTPAKLAWVQEVYTGLFVISNWVNMFIILLPNAENR